MVIIILVISVFLSVVVVWGEVQSSQIMYLFGCSNLEMLSFFIQQVYVWSSVTWKRERGGELNCLAGICSFVSCQLMVCVRFIDCLYYQLGEKESG